eukprot:6910993-Prymnesium_polylepis.1
MGASSTKIGGTILTARDFVTSKQKREIEMMERTYWAAVLHLSPRPSTKCSANILAAPAIFGEAKTATRPSTDASFFSATSQPKNFSATLRS